MLDAFKQFFTFDKFMKDRLVSVFFYLGLVFIVIAFWATLQAAFTSFGYSFFGGVGLLFVAFFQILFLFVGLRLLCELMVAVFHINDNLSPDGGKSETADIDIFETTREAATKAARSASSATKSAINKTKTKLAERDHKTADDYPDYEDPTPPKPTTKKTVKKASAKNSTAKKKTAKKPAAKRAPSRKSAAKKTTKK